MFSFCALSFGFAQLRSGSESVKKVAIMEVVDKEGKISYGVKLMLRSSLAAAITQTPGYEGYDRVDMSSIMDEQKFQRTGAVSDADIKKLGEMTGAAYVLVAEAALVDAAHLYITAKVLNVESARLEKTVNEMSGVTAEEFQKSCRKLANQLFAANVPVSQAASAPVENRSQSSNRADRVIDEVNSAGTASYGGYYTYKKGKVYSANGGLMTNNDLRNLFNNQDYNEWEKMFKLRKAGRALWITGVCVGSLGFVLGVTGIALEADGVSSAYNDYYNYDYSYDSYYNSYSEVSAGAALSATGWSFFAIGASLGIAGGVMDGVAVAHMKKMVRSYSADLLFGASPYGLGLALRF